MRITTATAILIDGLLAWQRLATAIKQAGAESRDEIPDEVVEEFRKFDDAARKALQDEINHQRGDSPGG